MDKNDSIVEGEKKIDNLQSQMNKSLSLMVDGMDVVGDICIKVESKLKNLKIFIWICVCIVVVLLLWFVIPVDENGSPMGPLSLIFGVVLFIIIALVSWSKREHMKQMASSVYFYNEQQKELGIWQLKKM